MMTARTPGTPASKIERAPISTPGGPKAREEKIVVTVRLRPLSKREQLAKDQVAWECVDDHTIVSNSPHQDRSAQQGSFTFDKVFGPASLTETVYEEGVKNVALSSLMGINVYRINDCGRKKYLRSSRVSGSERDTLTPARTVISAPLRLCSMCRWELPTALLGFLPPLCLHRPCVKIMVVLCSL